MFAFRCNGLDVPTHQNLDLKDKWIHRVHLQSHLNGSASLANDLYQGMSFGRWRKKAKPSSASFWWHITISSNHLFAYKAPRQIEQVSERSPDAESAESGSLKTLNQITIKVRVKLKKTLNSRKLYTPKYTQHIKKQRQRTGDWQVIGVV